MQLVWRKPTKAEDRARVVAWSCRCRSTVYELRRMGGQSYIRRTEYDDKGRETIYETHRWSYNKAAEVWATLLEGQAV
ncbi:hypothetical protein ABGB18_43535 [Nonomuraea sp. B12E4]|uniref:hypothetical protein n=1 Tax=Nonomuraea sp. B12E4 TaxID=3153564 RepID=UPI00325EF3AA